jgi:hypothetical protein
MDDGKHYFYVNVFLLSKQEKAAQQIWEREAKE